GSQNAARSRVTAVPRPPVKASLTDVVPRRTLVILSVVVVLAVLGTVLALALGGDGSGAEDNKGGDKAATSGSSAGDSGKGSGKDADKGTGTGDDQGKDPSEGASSGSGEDKGRDDKDQDDKGKGEDDAGKKPDDGAESTYKHGQGFKIGLPKGWKYGSTSRAGARFTGPDGQKLLVGWTTSPKDDPVRDWKNQERYMVRSQYHKIRIEKVGYRGWNTADWEFTYVDGGTKYRSIDRGFVVNDGLGYGMMYTAKADDWGGEQRRATWRTLTKTFEPKS
ncbi:serine/threonine protein kinase, partial [Streptomyces sp. NPDC005918]|uniref:serine/threonine protein kinase n=1 Tax=Streptomyces sp. NPDC005918 TaxID=3155454 RepID=UPI0033C63805